MITEISRKVPSGYGVLVALLVAQGVTIYAFVQALLAIDTVMIVTACLAMLIVGVCWFGFFLVHPNEAKVLQLFGKYVGTAHDSGLRWAEPVLSKVACVDAGAEFRKRQAEGERFERQSDRNSSRRRLAGYRYG